MRYTLRLLTLDQLSRAAGLVCALELEREDAPERYGTWPFEIGLWVGKAATPNVMGRKGDGRQDTRSHQGAPVQGRSAQQAVPDPARGLSVVRRALRAGLVHAAADDDQPRELRIVCTNLDCDFIGDRPLPIVAVDEPIYRRLPAFLVATVDKFATLPWVGAVGRTARRRGQV